MKTATIVSAEKVPKADKLLKLTLDAGEENHRIVLSGIAAYYEPEELPGLQVCVVANLAPRKMRGVLSQGMILMADNEDGKPVFVQPQQAVPSGSGVK